MSVVVVLGMHKSGTTLIADTLHRSGISMIEADNAQGYDDGNKMEREATRQLNLDLLDAHGIESMRVIQPLKSGAVTAAQRDQARALVSSMGTDAWGFKEPRTLLTFDFWEEVLDKPILIGVFRNPVEVFSHYLRRAGRRWISRDPAFLTDTLRSWCIYNQYLLDMKRKYPNMLLMDYAEFMADDRDMQRLSDHLGRELMDCRKSGMQRSQPVRGKDYRLARMFVRLRYGMDAEKLYLELKDAVT